MSQQLLEDPGENARANPLHHPQVARRSRAKLSRESLPLAPRAHAVDDPCHRDAIGNSRSAAIRFGSLGGQQRLDAAPQRVRYVEEVLVHGPPESISGQGLTEVLGRSLGPEQ